MWRSDDSSADVQWPLQTQVDGCKYWGVVVVKAVIAGTKKAIGGASVVVGATPGYRALEIKGFHGFFPRAVPACNTHTHTHTHT